MDVEKIIKTKHRLPLNKRTMIHFALVHNKINDEIALALKPFEISIQQYNVLSILRGQKGTPANLSTINERMVSKMSNTTRLVDKLILKGYVTRKTCRDNRRKVDISITHEGLSFLNIVDGIVVETEAMLLKNFKEEDLIHLNTLLDKF